MLYFLIDSQSANLNKYFDDMNSFYEDLENGGHHGVGGPSSKEHASSEFSQKTTCSKHAIQSCFPTSSLTLFSTNQSCLYRRFVLNETISRSSSKQNEHTQTASQINEAMTTSSNVILRKYVQNEPKNQQIRDTNDKNEQQQQQTEAINKDSLVWRAYSVQDSIAAITVGIAVIFILSIVSLFIGLYLIYKRKSFVYHATATNVIDSGYPHDEH